MVGIVKKNYLSLVMVTEIEDIIFGQIWGKLGLKVAMLWGLDFQLRIHCGCWIGSRTLSSNIQFQITKIVTLT